MIPCPTCGTENPERAKFCSECAAPLTGGSTRQVRETRKLVTILFADVAGSTALGERLDPETLRALMGRYFAIMQRIIEAHGGTVEKFIGDAVMAVFGVPVVHEDDALRAVRAAAGIRAALDRDEQPTGLGQAIQFRIGLNTGEVFAGDPASGQAFVTGDAVNVAARLEAATPPGTILLGQSTFRLVRDAVTVEPVERIEAKGKSAPLAAYRLLTVDPSRAGHIRRLDVPLIGRERELNGLEQAFRSAVGERSCQLFTVLGPAGIGKSRLVAEFTATVESEATVLRGRCLSYGEGITYWPIGEIVRTAAAIEEADRPDTARAKLRATVDGQKDAEVLAARVASALGMSLEPAPQEEVFWAIRRLFEHLAVRRPLVIVIEDIHWAEPTLLDLLEHVADWSRDARILLLCPARPELLDTRSGWGGGKLNATTVLLEALGSDATTRLIAELPGGSALSDDVADRVLTAAEGNPLFVEEMLRMLVDDGALVETADGRWTAADALADVRIPASISALLTARLERLDRDERAVAERASVVGRVFERDAVTELTPEASHASVGPSLLALVRKELIRPDRSELTAGDAFSFRHILIRDAAYEETPKAERAVLHERFADWLERTIGERRAEYGEIVGYHLEQAHRYRVELGETGEALAALAARAGTHLAAAGGRAFDRGDMRAAVILLGRATDAFVVGSPARLNLVPDIAFALLSIGRAAEADGLLEVAIDEATAAGLTSLAIRADVERALLATLSVGPSPSSLETATRSIPVLEREGDDLGLARAYLLIAQAAWGAGQIEEAVAARTRAIDHATRAGDERTDRRVAFWGADFYGTSAAIGAILRRETELARSPGDPMQRAQALFSLAGLYAMRGRTDDARAAYRAVTETLDDLGARFWAAGSYEIGGLAEIIVDHPEQAERWLDTGIARLESLGATGFLSTMRGMQSIAIARQGRSDEALSTADRAIHEGTDDDAWTWVYAQIGRAIALGRLGDLPGAVEAARNAVQRTETTDWAIFHIEALLVLAEVLESAGDALEAKDAAMHAFERSIAKQNLMGERHATRILERLS